MKKKFILLSFLLFNFSQANFACKVDVIGDDQEIQNNDPATKLVKQAQCDQWLNGWSKTLKSRQSNLTMYQEHYHHTPLLMIVSKKSKPVNITINGSLLDKMNYKYIEKNFTQVFKSAFLNRPEHNMKKFYFDQCCENIETRIKQVRDQLKQMEAQQKISDNDIKKVTTNIDVINQQIPRLVIEFHLEDIKDFYFVRLLTLSSQ